MAAFFYGTLLSEKVLDYVLCGANASVATLERKRSALECRPATLHGFKRHALKGRPYPGLLPTSSQADYVKGIYCNGLSEQDIALLDAYEGEEYERRIVKVQLDNGDNRTCNAYVWIAGMSMVLEHDWDYGAWQRSQYYLNPHLM